MTRTRAPWRSRINWRVFAIVCSCLAVMLGPAWNLEAGYRVYPGAKQPKRTTVLTAAGAIVSPSSTGCAGGACADQRRVDGTNFDYYTLNYADGSTQTAYWSFTVPLSYGGTTADVTLYWMPCQSASTCSGAITDQNVVWQPAIDGKSAGAAFDAALPAASSATSASGTTAGVLKSLKFSSATTGWVGGEVAVVGVSRLGADASDSFTGTAKLVQVKIEWTASKESDE